MSLYMSCVDSGFASIRNRRSVDSRSMSIQDLARINRYSKPYPGPFFHSNPGQIDAGFHNEIFLLLAVASSFYCANTKMYTCYSQLEHFDDG